VRSESFSRPRVQTTTLLMNPCFPNAQVPVPRLTTRRASQAEDEACEWVAALSAGNTLAPPQRHQSRPSHQRHSGAASINLPRSEPISTRSPSGPCRDAGANHPIAAQPRRKCGSIIHQKKPKPDPGATHQRGQTEYRQGVTTFLKSHRHSHIKIDQL